MQSLEAQEMVVRIVLIDVVFCRMTTPATDMTSQKYLGQIRAATDVLVMQISVSASNIWICFPTCSRY